MPAREQGDERALDDGVLANAAVVGVIVYIYAYWGQAWIPVGRTW